MSDALESLIRPFESGNISPAQTYYPAGEVGVPNVKLQYGRGGSGKSVSGSFSLTIASYCASPSNEKPHDKSETHIVRLAGQMKSGDKLEDVWIDVERRDRANIRVEGEGGSREVMVKIRKWDDEKDAAGEGLSTGEETGRKLKKLKICAHDEENYEDPEIFVELEVIEKLSFIVQEGAQAVEHTVNVTAENDGRKVKKRRITNHETTIDKRAAAAFEKGARAYVVKEPKKNYKKVEGGETNKDDWIEIEVIQSYSTKRSRSGRKGGSPGTDISTQVNLKNQHHIEGSEAAKLDRTGEDGINPPYRLDPFQNIVNCQFREPLAVEFKKDNA